MTVPVQEIIGAGAGVYSLLICRWFKGARQMEALSRGISCDTVMKIMCGLCGIAPSLKVILALNIPLLVYIIFPVLALSLGLAILQRVLELVSLDKLFGTSRTSLCMWYLQSPFITLLTTGYGR